MSNVSRSHRSRGKFITLEGTEGAGKSTNLEVICEWLRRNDIEFIVTREPGGTEIAEKIRALLVDPENAALVPMAELLLIFAARAQHLSERILPALDRGLWVVSDRFTDATYAYQGAARGLGEEKVRLLEQMVQGELRPDKTIVLDVPVEIGVQRMVARGKLDRFEKERAAFFEAVRDSYLTRAASLPKRYAVVDAAQSLDIVGRSVEAVLEALR